MTAIARPAWLALLTFALAGIGCGQQDESHTNTGPETNASAPTPATETPADRSTPAPSAAPATPSDVNPAPAPAPAPEPTPAEPAPAPDATKPASEAAPDKSAATEDGDGDSDSDGAVTLEKVNYETFRQRVAANPGKAKYTIVDCWATWCGPCKENFPHVVQMHEKYGDKGLAVASMSFDDPAESKQVDDARAFLREKNATFTNYLLDEEAGVGFEKFGINAIPAVFLYGPNGQEVKRFTMDDPNNQFTYDEVEKTVAALLEGKPDPGK